MRVLILDLMLLGWENSMKQAVVQILISGFSVLLFTFLGETYFLNEDEQNFMKHISYSFLLISDDEFSSFIITL